MACNLQIIRDMSVVGDLVEPSAGPGISFGRTLSICTEVQQYPEPTFRAVTTAKQSRNRGYSQILGLPTRRET